jgi:hypothetical protein
MSGSTKNTYAHGQNRCNSPCDTRVLNSFTICSLSAKVCYTSVSQCTPRVRIFSSSAWSLKAELILRVRIIRTFWVHGVFYTAAARATPFCTFLPGYSNIQTEYSLLHYQKGILMQPLCRILTIEATTMFLGRAL